MISVRGLSHSYGSKAVLRDINLEVDSGEILALMGSSGGGKTTLLRCISGLVTPSEGDVVVDSINVQHDPEVARRHMGMVFQSAALFDYMTVEENVLFGLKRLHHLNGDDLKKRTSEALSRVGLEDAGALMPAELSGGMRKRVGIARAIALEPKVLLYDEPTTGLDPVTTYTIDGLIRSLREELGVTSLLVSHDVTSVMRTSDRVAFLEEGQISFLGTPQEFEQAQVSSIQELLQKSRVGAFDAVE
jgi:phospholipid/cholesterol/gamma-HCH transport system ATP-binding protein